MSCCAESLPPGAKHVEFCVFFARWNFSKPCWPFQPPLIHSLTPSLTKSSVQSSNSPSSSLLLFHCLSQTPFLLFTSFFLNLRFLPLSLFLSPTLIPNLPSAASPLQSYLSLCLSRSLSLYLSATGNGFFPNPRGWRGVLTVPNKEVTVWILQKYKEEKEGR